MESGAKGCEVIVSGKLRAQRAKAMKFKDGFMIASGNPVHDYIDGAVRHVMLRQGVLGIKVCLVPLSTFAGAKNLQHLHACSLRIERLCMSEFASLVGTQWYASVLTWLVKSLQMCTYVKLHERRMPAHGL